mmetsp:Transcript_5904/g.18285  ORF Transcript_5904/g.18285 Transcript_5904/m.18285 type:complete len:314 (-) Transcript_5904:130-1071(-)
MLGPGASPQRRWGPELPLALGKSSLRLVAVVLVLAFAGWLSSRGSLALIAREEAAAALAGAPVVRPRPSGIQLAIAELREAMGAAAHAAGDAALVRLADLRYAAAGVAESLQHLAQGFRALLEPPGDGAGQAPVAMDVGLLRATVAAAATFVAALVRRSPSQVLDSMLQVRVASGLAPALPSPAVAPWVLGVFSVCVSLHSLALLGEMQQGAGAAAGGTDGPPPQLGHAQPPAAVRGFSASQAIVAVQVGIAIGVGCTNLPAWLAKRQRWLATTRAVTPPDAEAPKRSFTRSASSTSPSGANVKVVKYHYVGD